MLNARSLTRARTALAWSIALAVAATTLSYSPAFAERKRCDRSKLSERQLERLEEKEAECKSRDYCNFTIDPSCTYSCRCESGSCTWTPLRGSRRTAYECQGVKERVGPSDDDLIPAAPTRKHSKPKP
jgi:hypothetical protein